MFGSWTVAILLLIHVGTSDTAKKGVDQERLQTSGDKSGEHKSPGILFDLQVKRKDWGSSGCVAGCTTGFTDNIFTCIAMDPLLKNKDCNWEIEAIWKSGAGASLPAGLQFDEDIKLGISGVGDNSLQLNEGTEIRGLHVWFSDGVENTVGNYKTLWNGPTSSAFTEPHMWD